LQSQASLVLACLLWSAAAAGQEARYGESVVFTAAAPGAGAHGAAASPPSSRVRGRTLAIYGAAALGLALYANKNWWDEGFTRKFRTIDEGWFGENTADGGADKLGHFMATYTGTRLLARGFEWAGNDSDTALRYGALSLLGTFTAVEVLDGFTTRWRFSKEDATMNAIGVAVAVLMEKRPGLDRLIDLRLHYRPSSDPSTSWGFDPFGDYSGQTYLLVAKATGVPALREHPVWRYLELAVGYGTRGYHVGPGVPGDRSRNIYYGVSLNLSELLSRTAFRASGTRSGTQRFFENVLEFVQVPGTVALAKHRL
jgi:hypothetical protein